MFVTMGAPAVARKGRPKSSERDDVTVKLDRTIVSRAKLIAADEGVSLAEYLSTALGPVVERAYGKLVRKFDDKASKGDGG